MSDKRSAGCLDHKGNSDSECPTCHAQAERREVALAECRAYGCRRKPRRGQHHCRRHGARPAWLHRRSRFDDSLTNGQHLGLTVAFIMLPLACLIAYGVTR